ncbi:MAG: 1,4-dihydroxy-6-naphthoate synthase [Geobacteraceae bacterium]|nr:1,4-dihydroxy-6-naphthoate synthase [Geobacteraceae bacterium]
MRPLTLGFSPCPNDTFLFYPLVHARIETGDLRFRVRLEDVETLNRLAHRCSLDVCKVSWHAYAFLRDRYVMLRAGGAMGRGCGPLVVSRERLGPADLRGRRVAVPGRGTTALLLLRMFDREIQDIVALPFHEIMDAVERGTVDAGAVIHESRFICRSRGLHTVLDLGEWWEGMTGLPLPLGGIAARRSLGSGTLAQVDGIIRSSVHYARRHPEESAQYVRLLSREKSGDACAAHIGLYVNEFTLDPGREGEEAAAALLAEGERLGLLPKRDTAIFLAALSSRQNQ